MILISNIKKKGVGHCYFIDTLPIALVVLVLHWYHLWLLPWHCCTSSCCHRVCPPASVQGGSVYGSLSGVLGFPYPCWKLWARKLKCMLFLCFWNARRGLHGPVWACTGLNAIFSITTWIIVSGVNVENVFSQHIFVHFCCKMLFSCFWNACMGMYGPVWACAGLNNLFYNNINHSVWG
jgi:hypothetical protein